MCLGGGRCFVSVLTTKVFPEMWAVRLNTLQKEEDLIQAARNLRVGFFRRLFIMSQYQIANLNQL